MKYNKCLSYPLPFYANQILTTFTELKGRYSKNSIILLLLKGISYKILFDLVITWTNRWKAQIEPQWQGHGRNRRHNRPHHRRDEVIQRLFIKIFKYALKILI